MPSPYYKEPVDYKKKRNFDRMDEHPPLKIHSQPANPLNINRLEKFTRLSTKGVESKRRICYYLIKTIRWHSSIGRAPDL
jgi:hypothetical protein